MEPNIRQIDLTPRTEQLLRRLTNNKYTFADPLTHAELNAPDSRTMRHLVASGLVQSRIMEDNSHAYFPTPSAEAWLDEFGRDEFDRDRRPDPLPEILSPDVLARLRLLLADMLAETPALATTLGLRDLAAVVFVKGLDTIDALRRGEPVHMLEATTPALPEGATVRVVGSLIVWADVCVIIGARNPTLFASRHKITLHPLPPHQGNGRPGRPPTTGILPEDLDKIEGKYPIEFAIIKEAASKAADPTTPAAPVPTTPADTREFMFRIRCKHNGWIFSNHGKNIQRRLEADRARLERGTHTCAALQRDWNTYGAAAFEFSVGFELLPNVPPRIKQRLIQQETLLASQAAAAHLPERGYLYPHGA